jgi:hypothetical protein
VNQLFDVMLYTSTTDEDEETFQPPPNATISPIDDDAGAVRG